MKCNIEWIVIPAPDLEKAGTFYNNVFGFTIREFSENFRVFEAGNLNGGLDNSLIPDKKGISFSITVQNIDDYLKNIVTHGGMIIRENIV